MFYEEEDSRVSDFWFHLFASVFFSFVLIGEFLYQLSGLRLLSTLRRLLASLLVYHRVPSLRTRSARSVKWLWGDKVF